MPRHEPHHKKKKNKKQKKNKTNNLLNFNKYLSCFCLISDLFNKDLDRCVSSQIKICHNRFIPIYLYIMYIIYKEIKERTIKFG